MHLRVTARGARAMKRVLLGGLFVLVDCWAAAQGAVVITSAATHGITCSAGVCTPTRPNATLNITELANMLAQGDVKVAANAEATDIQFTAPLSWTSSYRLTLDSARGILVSQPIAVAGGGGLTLVTNDGGNGGDLVFGAPGHVEFWDRKSSLVINGNSYVLIKNLRALADAVANNPAGFYALARNYNASKDGVYASTPVTGYFDGMFEGLGNSIKSFSLDGVAGNSNYALFEDIGGTVENLLLKQVDVSTAQVATAALRETGGLAGRNYGTIRGVSVSGTVQGSANVNVDDTVGGLVGLNYGTIERSSSSASVRDGAFTGGLIGSMGSFASVADSFATGKVSSRGNAGGLAAGVGSNSFVINSYATGNVDDLLAPGYESANLGGLIGDSSATVSDSYATGTVKGGGAVSHVGGLIGANSGSIGDSYAKGRRVGGKTCYRCGGLVGVNGGTITDSYSTSFVSAPACWCGGLIGEDDASPSSLSNTYWDLDTSGVNDPSRGAFQPANDPGVKGRSTGQLQSGLPSGFSRKVWSINSTINGGYPYLKALQPQ